MGSARLVQGLLLNRMFDILFALEEPTWHVVIFGEEKKKKPKNSPSKEKLLGK